jgi:hypothetical protein
VSKPSPLCLSDISGPISCAPCDVPPAVSGDAARRLADSAHLALLGAEVDRREIWLAWAEPGTELYEAAARESVSVRAYESDAHTGSVAGYGALSSDPAGVGPKVLYRLRTVGFSGSDRVHIQADLLLWSPQRNRYFPERTSYFCVTVGAENVIRSVWSR